MASRRAQGPAEGHDQKATARPTPARSTRARGKHGKDPKDVERARLALKLAGGNVTQAAKATGIPRTNIRRWIAAGDFNPDEWEKLRQERARDAIETAYAGLQTNLEALRDLPHQIYVTKEGEVVDTGVDHKAAAQVVRAQVEVVRVLGGTGAKAAAADGEGSGDQTVRIEIVPPSWPDYDASGKIIPFRRTG